MTIDEAYEEMRRRAWGYRYLGGMIAVGPFDVEGCVLEVYGADTDLIRAVEKAIERSRENDTKTSLQ